VSEVVIAGGGTGGHLFPGLAAAAALREAGAAVSWLGAARGLEARHVPAAGVPLRLLPVSGAVGRAPHLQAVAVLSLAPAVVAATTWLLRRHAAAVLSVGGYAGLPGAIAACSLGVPLVIQEQNALPGLTQRLLAPWAVAIACGFESTLAAFPSLPAVWTGNPVRPQFSALPERAEGPTTVFVTGGSQGAAVLNRVVPEALALSASAGITPRIVHQAGPRWESEVRERYASLGLTADVVGFLERPWQTLAVASIVIARAGALTVCELATAGRFALLVPFAAAAHGHQLHNARALAATGAAVVVDESRARPAMLADLITSLLRDPASLAERWLRGRGLARHDAAEALARLVLSRATASTAGGLA
jgi:UDP-N-acetylglucosamine--N-acetylmuramyl-(pentapeptide) pyrophosphoryl-undecaprenol N-acetylglucosamine transferase